MALLTPGPEDCCPWPPGASYAKNENRCVSEGVTTKTATPSGPSRASKAGALLLETISCLFVSLFSFSFFLLLKIRVFLGKDARKNIIPGLNFIRKTRQRRFRRQCWLSKCVRIGAVSVCRSNADRIDLQGPRSRNLPFAARVITLPECNRGDDSSPQISGDLCPASRPCPLAEHLHRRAS